MIKNIFLLTAILAISFALIGCGDSGTNANNANTVSNTLANAEPVRSTPEETLNEAPTLKPVFMAYCAAMAKKDEAAIRKVYSADTLKNFEEQMKEDNIKTLLEFLADDKISGDMCSIRNETITGDSAVAEIKADTYPNGIKVVFVKEGGEWKITNRSPAIDAVKNAANSNTTAAPANTK